MRTLALSIAAFMLTFAIGAANAVAQTASSEPSAVYHFDDAAVQALRGLRAARNQLDAMPGTNLTLVAHADGVGMFMVGARDATSGVEYAPLIADLRSRGVEIYVCELTLQLLDLNKDAFILEADFTPSGVGKITELQQVNGFAYIKP
jgi:intracellular sulfur oxidation DsrE/DsrF family protein